MTFRIVAVLVDGSWPLFGWMVSVNIPASIRRRRFSGVNAFFLWYYLD